MRKEFQVIHCEQNEVNFYLGVIDRDTLESTCIVSRADEDLKKGFQRLLNEGRASQIAKYLDNKKGAIPSALILSAQKRANFKFDKKSGKASFDVSSKNLLVLDGQHRLYGYIKSKSNFNIPVVIFSELLPKEEVNLFIDINTNQRGVSSSLLLDIKNLTGNETTIEEKQRELFDSLEKNSVLSGKLSPRKSSPGKISKKAFYDATKAIFEAGRFADAESIHTYYGVKNFLEASDLVLSTIESKNARLTKTVIFKALFNIFQDVVELCLKKYGNIKMESLEKELKPISILNFENYNGSSASLINQITTDFRREINRNNDISYNFDNDLF